MRNTYLIDFENVGSDGLAGVLSLTAEDRVIIFYSTNSNRMTVRAHQQIVASAAQFDYFEVTVGGKNALDHQLGTYLGYLVATNASERYFIVSHDNGFKFLSAFWLARDNTLQISLSDNIKASLRVRPSERPRPVNNPLPRPAEQVQEPAPAVEAAQEEKPVPLEETPKPAAIPEQIAPPAPVAELTPVAAEKPAVSQVETPAEEEPAPQLESPAPTSPLPALGSQSRSRNYPHRSHVRSESILATLKSVEPKRTELKPAEPEPQTEPQVEPEQVPVSTPKSAMAPAPETPVEQPQAAPVEETLPKPGMELAVIRTEQQEHTEEPKMEPAEGRPNRNRRNSRSRNDRRPHSSYKEKELKTVAGTPAEAAQPEKAAEPQKKAPKAEPEAETKPTETVMEPVKQEPAGEEPKPQAFNDAAFEAISALLKEYPKINEARVRELIASSKKQVLCNTLRRQLGQEQGLALYNQIKRLAWK